MPIVQTTAGPVKGYQALTATSSDYREAVTAFLEKRPPEWKWR